MYQLNPLLESADPKKEKRSENLKAGYAGGIAGQLAPTAVAAPVLMHTKTIFSPFDPSENTYEIPKSIAKLKVNGKESVPDYMKRKGLSFTRTANMAGPNFNPLNNTISLPIKEKHMDKWGKSIFAHELGHSAKMQIEPGTHKGLGKVVTYNVSKNITGIAAFVQIINCFRSDDESRQRVGKALSVAGGASALPMIAEEIGASMRGTKMLGLKGMDRARAFMGVGSYIALAFSPAIMYYVSERTRKFLRSLKQIKDENPEVAQNLENLKQSDVKVKV